MLAREVSPGPLRLMRAARFWLAALAVLLGTASASWAAPNQFAIVSDIHPSADPKGGGREAQMRSLTEQLVKLNPTFVIQLGDFCGDPGADPDLSRLEHGVQIFHRLREAGIDVYPVMGNHDIETDNKINFLCGHTPPFNPELDPKLNQVVYDRWCRQHRYWYSFNRGGIHFVIIDSNLSPKTDPGGEPPLEAMQSFMARDLCQHQNNPNQFPTLVFLHHPEYMTGDRGCTGRPLRRALAQGLEQGLGHTVAAAFAGHWHYYQYFPAEEQLGVQVYATPPSVHSERHNPEYIVATVEADRITFATVDTATGGPGKSGAVYYPIAGKFTSLDDRSAKPVAN